MRAFVAHPHHQHGPAEIVQVGADAEGAPAFREAAVGGDDQRALQHAAILQAHARGLRVGLHAGHLDPGQHGHIIRLLHGLPGGAADRMVGHQPSQLRLPALGVREQQAIRIIAIDHLGIAQVADVLGPQALPQAVLVHQPVRAMGQGDLAAIVGGIGQRGFGLLLDKHDAQAKPRQRPRKTQAHRARADDDDVVLHDCASTGLRPTLSPSCRLAFDVSQVDAHRGRRGSPAPAPRACLPARNGRHRRKPAPGPAAARA